MTNQQGDILHFQTNNDGDISIETGMAVMTGGFETAVYISLFGGEADWWGDIGDASPNVSETAKLIENIPAIPANLVRINDAVRRDLQWILDKKIANRIDVDVTMPGVDRVAIFVTIAAIGGESEFDFVENWRSV